MFTVMICTSYMCSIFVNDLKMISGYLSSQMFMLLMDKDIVGNVRNNASADLLSNNYNVSLQVCVCSTYDRICYLHPDLKEKCLSQYKN